MDGDDVGGRIHIPSEKQRLSGFPATIVTTVRSDGCRLLSTRLRADHLVRDGYHDVCLPAFRSTGVE
jgi:hypothetical protein